MKRRIWIGLVFVAALSSPLRAQQMTMTDSMLDRLTREALHANAGLAAASSRARASDARVRPAGTLADPTVMVGVMDLTLELRLADNTVVDRKGLQLEWSARSVPAPAKSQPRRVEATEIALMMKNGAELMANGDIAAARMMFQRAAEAGEAKAAFSLAETYDPLVLRKLGARGAITADIAMARSWYEKAREMGSTVAPERIVRLTQIPR